MLWKELNLTFNLGPNKIKRIRFICQFFKHCHSLNWNLIANQFGVLKVQTNFVWNIATWLQQNQFGSFHLLKFEGILSFYFFPFFILTFCLLHILGLFFVVFLHLFYVSYFLHFYYFKIYNFVILTLLFVTLFDASIIWRNSQALVMVMLIKVEKKSYP